MPLIEVNISKITDCPLNHCPDTQFLAVFMKKKFEVAREPIINSTYPRLKNPNACAVRDAIAAQEHYLARSQAEAEALGKMVITCPCTEAISVRPIR